IAAASLALALCSGEGAVATVFFLAAHALFLDERPIRARLAFLSPSMIVVFSWVVAYRVGHYGAIGSGVYHHPLSEPGPFLASLVTHTPLLLGSELGAPWPDSWPFLPLAAKVVLVVLSLAVLIWASPAFVRLVRARDERVRRLSRFFLCAGVLSVLPGT